MEDRAVAEQLGRLAREVMPSFVIGERPPDSPPGRRLLSAEHFDSISGQGPMAALGGRPQPALVGTVEKAAGRGRGSTRELLLHCLRDLKGARSSIRRLIATYTESSYTLLSGPYLSFVPLADRPTSQVT
jgi:hypothetical protein